MYDDGLWLIMESVSFSSIEVLVGQPSAWKDLPPGCVFTRPCGRGCLDKLYHTGDTRWTHMIRFSRIR